MPRWSSTFRLFPLCGPGRASPRGPTAMRGGRRVSRTRPDEDNLKVELQRSARSLSKAVSAIRHRQAVGLGRPRWRSRRPHRRQRRRFGRLRGATERGGERQAEEDSSHGRPCLADLTIHSEGVARRNGSVQRAWPHEASRKPLPGIACPEKIGLSRNSAPVQRRVGVVWLDRREPSASRSQRQHVDLRRAVQAQGHPRLAEAARYEHL